MQTELVPIKEMDSSESIDYSVSSNNKLTIRYTQSGDPQTFTIKELTVSTLKPGVS